MTTLLNEEKKMKDNKAERNLKSYNCLAYFKDGVPDYALFADGDGTVHDPKITVRGDTLAMQLPINSPVQVYVSRNAGTTMPEAIKGLLEIVDFIETLIEEERDEQELA